MSDPPNMGIPKEEGPIDTDVKPGTGSRRASGTARRSRRKKDDDPDTKKKETEPKEAKEAKEKPTRAPRRPREKSNNTASRKKPKLQPAAEETRVAPVDARSPPHAPATPQPAQPAQPTQPTQIAPPPHPAPTSYSNPHPPTAPAPSYQLSQPSRQQSQSQPPVPQPPPQRTSGQNFDPIRSAFDNPSPAPSYSPPARTISPRNAYRASASPAISSIIDPPAPSSQPIYNSLQRSSSSHVSGLSSPAPPAMVPTLSHPSLAPSPLPTSSASRGAMHIPQAMSQSTPYTTPYPPTEQRPTPSQTPTLEQSPPAVHQPQPPAQPAVQPTPPRQQAAESMEIDPAEEAPSAKKEKSTSSAPASKASSPKPARPAKEAPHLPQGSGLITTALFGGGDDSAKSPDSRSTPSIIVHVPLQKGNQIVNFARLAEEQYGFAALHPRLAAHKARMARVAAAGAALERNDKNAKGNSAGESADEDLSLDAERDSDMDGDVPMGGIGAGTNGAPSEASDGKKKRRKKVEEYDRDDPFVDDTEMVWQEQAAASKDGFFVYSGPLVPEGEKVQVERADGTIKRGRGRGRGTGRGRTVTSHPHVPIAAAVPVSQDTGLPLRGPGSRGGTSRRPRGNKKADSGSDRAATAVSVAHESRGGRGGTGTPGRGGTNSTRGGKSSISIPMPDLAPAPSTPSVAHGPPTPSPLAGPDLMTK
ncbi:Histone promoter control protein 2 [Penicillium digitatum]|uniref:Histone promoter control protein 2 n=3 Tax=Penicillium digitatum TaxID=36651 RepID=K9G6K0_PEND2|nr:Histone promoter control protein 2 [Penicillium digitatum Pd1]EKV16582.1 Histone promoter control protein 2 [Penicillium digitatum PHI26]EKV21982.1 Histone promoter control protein 2 [Penicillium digitatum Pd1]QQK47823.1 Histone promoter control protein 2 [Penicillium digitatum]